jgi:hypothetical protein
VFSASLSLNSSALEQMSSLLVNEPNEPIQFVARFFANGDVNNQSANHEVLSMEKLVVSEIDDKADKSEVSSGSNDDNTTKNSNPPQVLGVKIMDHPTDSKLRILHVIVIDRNLAVEPYSFDGGKVWTKQSSVEVDRRIWFDKSLIKVRDAAGNQTQLQGKIYTYN